MSTVQNVLNDWDKVGDDEADLIAQEVFKTHPVFQGSNFTKLAIIVGRWIPGASTGEMPDSFGAFLREQYVLPKWVDDETIERAQTCYAQYSQAGEIVLASYSLPILYIHPEIAASLMGTGRLVLQVRQRLDETLVFVDEVMKPGALRANRDGWKWVRKVRLTHAILRIIAKLPAGQHHALQVTGLNLADPSEHPLALLRARFPVDRPDYVPMSQAQLAFVLQTFAWVMIDGLAKLGVSLTKAEQKDHVRCWSAIGFMLGIVDPLLPRSELGVDEARRSFEHVRDRLLGGAAAESTQQITQPLIGSDNVLQQKPVMEGGRVLTGALLVVLQDVLRSSVPQRYRDWVAKYPWLDDALQSLPFTILRDMMGLQVARALRIGRAPLLHWLVGKIALTQIDLRKWRPAPLPRAAADDSFLSTTVPRGLF